MKIIEKILNVVTGEENIIERDETPAEKQEREASEAAAAERQVQAEAKAAQKTTLLNRLGITEDEAKLLLS